MGAAFAGCSASSARSYTCHCGQDEDFPEIGSPVHRGAKLRQNSDEELEAEVNRGLERLLSAASRGSPPSTDDSRDAQSASPNGNRPRMHGAEYDQGLGLHDYESQQSDAEDERMNGYHDDTLSPATAKSRPQIAELAQQRRQVLHSRYVT